METIGGQSSLDLLFCAGQNAIVIDRSRTENTRRRVYIEYEKECIYSDKPSCYFYRAMGPLKKPKNTKCKDGCFELLLLSGDGTIKETKNKETKCKDGCFELLFLSGDGTLKETKQNAKTVVLNCYFYRAMGPLKKQNKMQRRFF